MCRQYAKNDNLQFLISIEGLSANTAPMKMCGSCRLRNESMGMYQPRSIT